MFNYEKHIVKQRTEYEAFRFSGFNIVSSWIIDLKFYNHTVKLKGPELIIKPDFFL